MDLKSCHVTDDAVHTDVRLIDHSILRKLMFQLCNKFSIRVVTFSNRSTVCSFY